MFAMFLLMHYLEGASSFWYPYISVMNEADLVCFWDAEEIEQFRDVELMLDAELYKSEIETEWIQM